ncbi:MAG: hypothetical protein NVSMB30_05410 [Hymenobacter sp.]
MPISRHTFDHLDVDSDPAVAPATSFTAALNISFEPGYVTPVAGNVAVPYALPSPGRCQTVGACSDHTGAVLDFVWHSGGRHQITRTVVATGVRTLVLEWSGLALDPAKPVVGASVIDGLLVYLDANGELRSLSLARAANNEYTPALLAADPYALHLVKRPPLVTPTATRMPPPFNDPRASLNLTHGRAWQFAYRYRYVDGDVTPLGTYSPVYPALPVLGLSLLGFSQQTNFLRIPAPALPPFVDVIELCVRQDADPTWRVALELRRPAPGATAPAFLDFFGRTLGAVLTAAEATKIAEAAPIKAGTMAVAHSRVLVGDCTEGYPASAVAFTAVATTTDPAVTPVSRQVWRSTQTIGYYDGRTEVFTRFAYLVGGSYPDPASVYDLLDYDAGANAYVRPQGSRIPYFRLFTSFDLDGYHTDTVVADLGLQPVLLSTAPATTLAPTQTFKAETQYPVALQFYDAQGRPGGVVGQVPVATPARTYVGADAANPLAAPLPAPTLVRWTLPTTDPDAQHSEIPACADSYAVVVGANQSASFFLQFRAASVSVLNGRDSADKPLLGVLPGRTTTVARKLWVDIGGLVSGQGSPGFGPVGYVWAAGSGDQMRFVAEGVSALITGQYGAYLEVSYTGPAPAGQPIVEIYTPALLDQQPAFYERSPRYRIVRTAAGLRSYETSQGILTGDVAFAQREGYTRNGPAYISDGLAYWYEAMNALNEQASTWLDVRRGRPAFAVPGGSKQVRRAALLRFSGVKVQGTALNGLGQWEALSQYDELPQEQGAVTRLVVADQTQTDGSVLLALQERGANSVALNRAQLQTADNAPLLAITRAVLGATNTLRGGFGCTDPTSAVSYAGKVFYWSRARRELVRYDRNGLTPLSETYHARTRLGALALTYPTAGSVTACFNPHLDRQEVWLTFQGQPGRPGTTIVYSELYKAFADQVSAVPEAGLGLGSVLVTWQGGAAWQHLPGSPAATFYATYTAPQVTFLVAQPPGRAKQFRDVAVESGPTLWLPTALQTDTALTSQTLAAWFTNREGVWRAALRRASNVGTFPTVFHALDNGLPLVGARLALTLTAPPNAAPLTAASVSWTPRAGQGMGVA